MSDVVVFSGGRGATTIMSSLARTPGVDLTVVVNAYDAGLSTGRVRRAIPGMLGPSDIRKTAGTLALAAGDNPAKRLAEVLEYRIRGGEVGSAEAQFRALQSGANGTLDPHLQSLVSLLTVQTWSEILLQLRAFNEYLKSNNCVFDFEDLAIGNAVLAGNYLNADCTINDAISRYQSVFQLKRCQVLNINCGEDIWLTASASQWFCLDEGTLVNNDAPAPIDDLFLLRRDAYDELVGVEEGWKIAPDLIARVGSAEWLPTINPQVVEALKKADVIVYGPGTQHSSLFPTYLTKGLGEAIAANKNAEKIFVANLSADRDQHAGEGLIDILAKFQFFLSRRKTTQVNDADLLSSVLVNETDQVFVAQIDPTIRIRRAVWADPSGKHSGSAVLEEIASAVRMRSGTQMSGDTGMVSVVVPVLNEAPRVAKVLQELRYLDLSVYGLVPEIIVVDGGSDDGTLDVLHKEPDVRVIEAHCKGRGEAIHLGLSQARGEYVVVFPADGEYDVKAIREVVARLIEDPFRAVVASRTLGGSSAHQRLRAVYGKHRLLYFLSHWGGVFLTLLFMARLDRIISDPLSIVRGARRDIFRALDNDGKSLDYEVEWIVRAVQAGHGPVDVAVDYQPRGWREGKKSTIFDGIRAFGAVVTLRNKSEGTK
jgi:2-phospho-L-lactate transferase/gluconeogenesis factor (CofD/UPF0052 family)